MPKNSRVALVHLARHANGVAPLISFLESYKSHPAGIEHDLVVVLKGYEVDGRAAQVVQELLPPKARSLHIDDSGLDLDAYRKTFTNLDYGFFCFLNSFSRIASPSWLEKMMRWGEKPNVGIVGVTGSYQSVFTDEIHALLDVTWHYAKLCAHFARKPKLGLVLAPAAAWSNMPSHARSPFFLGAPKRLSRAAKHFAAFPNHHIRTNGFLVSYTVLKQLRWPPVSTKYEAYLLESGRQGITAQVMGMKLDPIVVGRDGHGYQRNEWHQSGTFWQDEQHNLLVEDNQTRQYSQGSEDTRRRLRRHAWRSLREEGK